VPASLLLRRGRLAAVALPFFRLVEKGPGFVALALVLALNVGHDMMYGPMAACLSELFGTHVRYTGVSLVYQLTSVFSGGLAPFVATLLLSRYGSTSVAAYMIACCIVTAAATWLALESVYDQPSAACVPTGEVNHARG